MDKERIAGDLARLQKELDVEGSTYKYVVYGCNLTTGEPVAVALSTLDDDILILDNYEELLK